MNNITESIYNQIIHNNMISAGDKVLVALSGGADSVFMLIMLKSLCEKLDFKLFAAHINHSIRGVEAIRDQKFCKDVCVKLSIPFHTVTLDIPQIAKTNGLSEETAGREERYKYFNELCNNNGYNKIAVAHNMNDSVETLLINLIRGCSLNGLGGIKPVNGRIIRPIIGIERIEIEKYLSDNNIKFCTDSTNNENIYTRNKIRNKIISDMKDINPSIIKTVYSNLKTLRDDNDCLCNISTNSGALTISDGIVSIDMNIFSKQHIAIKKRIIYDAFYRTKGNAKNIEQKHIDILLKNHISGKTFNMPDGVFVKTEFDKMIFYTQKKETEDFYEIINPDCCISGKNNKIKYEFKIVSSIKEYEKNTLYLDFDKLSDKVLYVRSRKNGDKFIPFGMTGAKKIKQYFTELKIPVDERSNIPILCANNEIIAVIPYRISEKYKVTDNTEQILRIQMIKE